MNRAALLSHQDVLDVVLLEQGIVDRQYGAAGIAKNDVNARESATSPAANTPSTLVEVSGFATR
jgi:hypothetical protein